MKDDNITFLKRAEDPLYQELYTEVKEYFIRNRCSEKGNRTGLIRACTIIVAISLLYIHILFFPTPYFIRITEAFFLGLGVAATGSAIAHDALHGTLYPTPYINKLFGYSMDLMGSSGYLWKINHSAHHAFTNVHGKDGDIKDSAILRLCPQAPYRRLHRYQTVTAIFIYALFYLLIVYVLNLINILGYNFGNGDTRKIHPPQKIIEFILLKLAYLSIWIFIPLYCTHLTFLNWLTGYLLVSLTGSISLTLLFFTAHDVESAAFEDCREPRILSWAAHQLNNTINFKTHPIVSYLVGGLNYQVEHHLFPGVSSVYYRDLSPIISRIARRHGVPYQLNDSFRASLRSHFRLLHQLSFPPSATDTAPGTHTSKPSL